MADDDDLKSELIALLPRLRRFGVTLTRSREQADDLVQGACERALRSAASWTPGTRLDSWMFRIMQNLWIDTLRKGKNERDAAQVDDLPGLAGEDGRRLTEARLTLAAVRAAIHNLPEEQRVVLALVCMEDLSYREAADTLGIPIGTVMSRLARARASLATHVALGRAGEGAAAREEGRP